MTTREEWRVKARLKNARKKWSGKQIKLRKVGSISVDIEGRIVASVKCKNGHLATVPVNRLRALRGCNRCQSTSRRVSQVGKIYGTREVIAQDLVDASRVVTRCECGAISETGLPSLKAGSACRSCVYVGKSDPVNHRRPDVVAKLIALRDEFPWMLDDTEESVEAVAIMVDHLGPLGNEEIGAFFGFARQRASQTEFTAKAAFKEGLALDEQRRQEHEPMGPFRRKMTDRTIWDVT